MRFALLAITAAALYAQSPEIRGSVIEQGSGVGLPGVEVTLYTSLDSSRVVATVFTDSGGNFAFTPNGFGQYRVDAKKAGYAQPRGLILPNTTFLSKEVPLWRPRVILMRPGTVSGRFVDEEGLPMPGLRILLEDRQTLGQFGSGTVTGPDGTFTATDVTPGFYFIRALPSIPDYSKVEDYSDEAFKRTDQGYEDLVWPSGVADQRDAVPLVVNPGGTSSLGTIHLRKVERYRVRLNVQGDCSGDGWAFALIKPPSAVERLVPHACRQQLLLTNVPAGSYEIALWSDDDNIRWAVAPVIVTRSNTTLNLTLSPATDVPGRIVTSKGVPLPAFTGTGFLLMMRPEIPGLSTSDAQEPQVQLDGTFVGRQLRWNRYRVSAPRIPAPYYVREIRYNGYPVADGRIELLPGAALEFELDNQPAHISGTVADGGQPFTGRAFVLLAKAPHEVPTAVEGNAPFSYLVPVVNGRFELSGLTPGEYRIAVSTDTTRLPKLIPSGEKITLERGQQRSLELKLK